MKRKILPIVISSIAAMTVQSALADAPKVYGKFSVSLQKFDAEENKVDPEDNWQLQSNSSRLGVKGSLDLNDSLKAVYKMEFEVYADDGDSKNSDTFEQRNVYVGLKGGWGTIMAGRHDTPLKQAQGKVDPFGDLALADIKYVIEGDNRMSNIVGYVSPKLGDVTATVYIIPGEESGVADDDSDDRNGPADGISASVKYKSDFGLYLALAVDQDVKNRDIIRGVAQYSVGDLTVGGIVSQGSHNETDSKDVDTSGVLVSASYKIDKWKLKAQVGTKTNEDNIGREVADDLGNISLVKDEADTTLLALGVDYKLAKSTTAFGYLGQVEIDDDFDDNDEEESTFGIGLIHKF